MTDPRLCVQKLINEAISNLLVDYRCESIDQESAEIALAKWIGRRFMPHTFRNGDTRRQLVVVMIVMKHHSKCNTSQKSRVEILFE